MASTSSAYWTTREDSTPSDFSGPVTQQARILSLADPNDPNNVPLHKGVLPEGASLLAIGTSLEEFDIETLKAAEPNVLFVSHPKAREPLADLLKTFPSIRWVHTRSAGIDFCTSETLAEFSKAGKIQVTNAKGCFSSTLAEYTMMACSYFAKDLPRLLQQKQAGDWQQYPILELRGATLGVVGYGDIGRAAAKLAKAYGMKILALRRNPQKAKDDPIVDAVYGNDAINELFSKSDYVLCAAPLTPETEKMIGKEQFDNAKKGAVFINVGRGPIVDEEALVDALKDGRLKGAGLDVTTIEPLPKDSPLWKLENVLLSPHNMDMTETFVSTNTLYWSSRNIAPVSFSTCPDHP
jgi:phosphoglycerate dehydrogenase-like enzyme